MSWPERLIGFEEAKAALTAAVFTDTEGDEPRQIVHRRGRFTGADCPLDEAIADCARSSSIAWITDDVFRHDLAVAVDDAGEGMTWYFDVQRPERSIPRVIVRVQLGDGPVLLTESIEVPDPAKVVQAIDRTDVDDAWEWAEGTEVADQISTTAGWGLVLAVRRQKAATS